MSACSFVDHHDTLLTNSTHLNRCSGYFLCKRAVQHILYVALLPYFPIFSLKLQVFTSSSYSIVQLRHPARFPLCQLFPFVTSSPSHWMKQGFSLAERNTRSSATCPFTVSQERCCLLSHSCASRTLWHRVTLPEKVFGIVGHRNNGDMFQIQCSAKETDSVFKSARSPKCKSKKKQNLLKSFYTHIINTTVI